MALPLTILQSEAATVYTTVDQTFNNDATVGSGHANNTFSVVSRTGIGTDTYTINYSYTVDLTLHGGAGTETGYFSVIFNTNDGIFPNQSTIGVDGASDLSNNLESGESFTATIDFTPNSRFTDVQFGAVQAYGTGDVRLNGNDYTNNNPSVSVVSSSFTIENIDPGTDTFGVGYINYRISVSDVAAVPEPTSTSLLGLGGLAMLLRRRKS